MGDGPFHGSDGDRLAFLPVKVWISVSAGRIWRVEEYGSQANVRSWRRAQDALEVAAADTHAPQTGPESLEVLDKASGFGFQAGSVDTHSVGARITAKVWLNPLNTNTAALHYRTLAPMLGEISSAS